MWPDGYRFISVISPRTRTRPNSPSKVRLIAPEISETVNSGRLVALRPGGRGSSMCASLCYTGRQRNQGWYMRVLVIGSGGREHALCWAIAASPLLDKLWCAPGNPGTAAVAENLPIGMMDFAGLVEFAVANKVDLVVPGPEAPLVGGITDAMEAAGIACCGPSMAAAQLEGSKTFAKEIADAAGIPTAKWERFEDASSAREFVRRRGAPIVIKADGLAAGKGVVVAATEDEALAAIDDIMERLVFGEAGAAVVIEECLIGEEVSLFALCDGSSAVLLGSAQDHKRVGDGDSGPNTGGMGAYAPVPALPPDAERA